MNEKLEKELREIIRISSIDLRRFEDSREEILRLNREIISCSARSIEASRRRERERASEHLSKAMKALKECYKIAEGRAQGKLRNLLVEGEKEFIEAVLTYSYVFDENYLKAIKELNASPFSIILGIFDFTGELRRIFVDKLLEGEFDDAKRIVQLLRTVYSEMIYGDIRSSIIPGFKRRIDVLRNQIERCVEDLNFSLRIREFKRYDEQDEGRD
ncbi:hypothetical protein DRN86_01495 [Candidatus Geothermarchaeota archaeon]|nr:MAG: hypothetical protein DRN86_01495 [Candidatus Geothermarchaeota archaeon]